MPVGAGEEDLIFEYLNLLVSRPEVARAAGRAGQGLCGEECNWAAVAAQYTDFLRLWLQAGWERSAAAAKPANDPRPRPKTRSKTSNPEAGNGKHRGTTWTRTRRGW